MYNQQNMWQAASCCHCSLLFSVYSSLCSLVCLVAVNMVNVYTHPVNWPTDCALHIAAERGRKRGESMLKQLQRRAVALSCWSVSVWACTGQKCAYSIAGLATQRHCRLQNPLIPATWCPLCNLPPISGLRATPSGHKAATAPTLEVSIYIYIK